MGRGSSPHLHQRERPNRLCATQKGCQNHWVSDAAVQLQREQPPCNHSWHDHYVHGRFVPIQHSLPTMQTYHNAKQEMFHMIYAATGGENGRSLDGQTTQEIGEKYDIFSRYRGTARRIGTPERADDLNSARSRSKIPTDTKA